MKKSTIIKFVIIVVIVIILGVLLKFTIDAMNKNSTPQMANQGMEQPNGNMQGQMGTNSRGVNYSASKEITEDATIESGEYSSETADENAILINGDVNVALSNIKVSKTGDSDGGDNTSFYGTNSALTAKDGANLTLKNINVTTNATGANGVFCYGGQATTENLSSDGTTITISDSTITTTKDNSGGIMTTGGGTMNASNLTVNTSGISSAAIRTDRGGGTVTVNGGTYTTTGQGSPAIYSTANITANNADLIAKASEGIVIEGKNSVTINNCNLTDSNTKLNGQSTTYKNIFLYQSMSGDAANGNSEFTANNSTITTNFTGMRPGELCALTWEDVDFENKVINVRHSVFDKKKNENGRWYIGTTKTKSGERQIHISPTLMKALVNFKNRQMELRLLYGKDYLYYHFEEIKNQYGKVLEYQIVENPSNILSMKPANMIFTRDNGKYCGTDIIKYPYKIIHDELGIQNCRFYDLRGSYATTILRNGVEIRDVADILGHKDIETTENYYISSTDENKKNVSNVFDNLMSSETINNIIKYKIAY